MRHIRLLGSIVDSPLLTDNRIGGWIIKYNAKSEPFSLKSGRKMYWVVVPDAFKRSIAEIDSGAYDINANVEHSDHAVEQIGTTASNIELEHRPDGVWFEMQLPDTELGKDLYKQIKLGIVTGVSLEAVRYDASKEDRVTVDGSGNYIKWLDDLKLTGFAVVTNPRFRQAQAFAFSAQVDEQEAEELEKEVEAVEPSDVRLVEAIREVVKDGEQARQEHETTTPEPEEPKVKHADISRMEKELAIAQQKYEREKTKRQQTEAQYKLMRLKQLRDSI